MSSYSKCLASLGLNGKIPGRELKDAAAEYQKDGMPADKAMLRAVEDKLELMLMEERKIVAAVRAAYEEQGGKPKPAKPKAPAKPKLTVVPKVEPAPVPTDKNVFVEGDPDYDALEARSKVNDKAVDALTDDQVKAMHAAMGLSGGKHSVEAMRDKIKAQHPDDVEAALQKPETVKVKDNYGRTHTVRKTDLDGKADRIPTVRKDGTIVSGEEIPRSIIKAAAGPRYSVSADEPAPASAKEFREGLTKKYPGLRLDLFDRGNGDLNLSLIVVPKDERSSGTGTKVMQEIVDYADATGKRLVLTTSDDFGGNKARLNKFYKRFGFVDNKGRAKDFAIMDGMYREPKGGAKFSVAGEDVTDTPAFKKWFGNSKVVDEDGRPLVIYHGTTADVSAFEPAFAGSDGVGYSAPAFFATSDQRLASDYAVNKFNRNIADAMRAMQRYKNENPGVYDEEYEARYQAVKDAFKAVTDSRETGGGANVMPLYMSLKNPLEIDAGGKRFMAVMPDAVARTVAKGYDGAIVHNVIDHASPASEYPATVYFALNPQQIKSATGNDGTFDPSNPDIRYSTTDDSAATGIASLMAAKDGEVTINRPDVGDITLVYGDGKSGLSHIAKRRGEEFMDRLPGLLRDGKVYTKEGQNDRIFIGNDRDEAVVRLDRDGADGKWLLSAYEKYPDLKASASVEATPAATGPAMRKADLRTAITKDGVLGQVIASMIDAGTVVLHDGPGTLPKGAGKGIKGVQAITAPDGTIHLVAPNLTPKNARAVMLHEAFHQGAEKLIGTAEWSKLMGRAGSLYRQSEQSSGKAREFFDKARARVASAKAKGAVATRMEVEEFMAYAIEEYESAPASIKKFVDDLIGLVKAWMVARFGKQIGAVTPAQLSALARVAIMDADYQRRGEIFGPKGEWFSVDDDRTIEVDGVRRPITNSKGQVIADDFAKQQAFWKWFGSSKVVDEEGKPLVVYHGTRHSFDEFEREGRKGRNRLHYFTDDPMVASEYSGKVQYGTPNVMPAYVSIQKPFSFDAGGASWGSLPLDLFPDEVAQHFDERNILRGRSDQAPLIGFTEVIRGALAAGYDGVIAEKIRDGGGPYGEQTPSKVIVAGRPEQIKSATGNDGSFSAESADIRYSVAADTETTATTTDEAEGLTPPPQNMLRRVQAAIQDNMNRVKEVQDRIVKQTGVALSEATNYYLAETNRPGRIAARLEDGERFLFKPLMEKLAKAGHTPEQLEELLHAMHAQERNETVAKINPDMEAGSGMTDERAAEILKQYEDDGFKSLHRLADEARAISKATLDLKLAYGMLTAERHEQLTTHYKNYVPLKGDGEYGAKVKRAMGHDERDEHILENIARDFKQAVIVGEKNLARHHLLRMVLQNPDPKLWTVSAPPKGRYIAGKAYTVKHMGQTVATFGSQAEVTGFMEAKGAQASQYSVVDSAGEQVAEFTKPLQDNEVMVYVKGDAVRIQINGDESLARQLRPLGQHEMQFIVQKFGALNRWFSKVYTGYNPAFILRNAVRDAGTGTVNMMGHYGTTTAAKAWARYPKAIAALGYWAATGKVMRGAAGEMMTEYRMHGGKVGASHMGDLEQQGKTLTRLYEDAHGALAYMKDGRPTKAALVAGRKLLRGMAHLVEIANQATENALRLALYTELRAQGKTPGIAAQAAKTVTVDFDRKGSATGVLGAFYLFTNPKVQGTANAIRTLAHGEKKGQAWAALGALAMAGLWLATKGHDDDKEKWLGEKWGIRSKNFIINTGEHQIRIPVSQEFAPAFAFGTAMAEARRGEHPGISAQRVLSSFLDAYFPLNNVYDVDSDNHAADAFMSIIPTAAQLPAHLAFNRNSFGSPIVPETPQTKDRADNLKMTRATKGTVYDKTAQWVADKGVWAGLAGKYENDVTKISPETIKEVWRTYAGGLGQFVADSASVTSMAAEDHQVVDWGDVPIVKDFVRSEGVKPIRGRYYDLTREARRAIAEFAQAKKAGDGDEMARLSDDREKGPLSSMAKMIQKDAKAAGAIRDEALDVNADKTMTLAEKRAKLKALEAEEEALYRQAIEAFKQ